MGTGWNMRSPRSRRRARLIRHMEAPRPSRPPLPSLPRRSARLQFPGVSPPTPPPLVLRRRKRFPLMILPRELRDLVYSEALARDCKALLRVSKQVREEAHPYVWKSSFLRLGSQNGATMVLSDGPGPQPKKLLYPPLPGGIYDVDMAYHDRVLNKLALIQNLAIEIDLHNVRAASPGWRHMLGQARPLSTLQKGWYFFMGRPRSPLDRPVGLLEPFLTPPRSSDRRNTCEITLKNFILDKRLLRHVVGIVARLDKFSNIFVTFQSPEIRKPGRPDARTRRRYYDVIEPLEAAFGPAIWHEGGLGEAGYLAFHPGRQRIVRRSG